MCCTWKILILKLLLFQHLTFTFLLMVEASDFTSFCCSFVSLSYTFEFENNILQLWLSFVSTIIVLL